MNVSALRSRTFNNNPKKKLHEKRETFVFGAVSLLASAPVQSPAASSSRSPSEKNHVFKNTLAGRFLTCASHVARRVTRTRARTYANRRTLYARRLHGGQDVKLRAV